MSSIEQTPSTAPERVEEIHSVAFNRHLGGTALWLTDSELDLVDDNPAIILGRE